MLEELRQQTDHHLRTDNFPVSADGGCDRDGRNMQPLASLMVSTLNARAFHVHDVR